MRNWKLALTGLVCALPLALAAMATGANIHANGHAVCPGPENDAATCHARLDTDVRGNPLPASPTPNPVALTPQDFWSAYKLSPAPAPVASGATIAIVDAYDDPTAESDLNTFSGQYQLPPCTTANGCFKKVNQNGNTNGLPRANGDWALEIALDVETAHGICPACKILLVEAKSNRFTDLSAAVDTAARLGAATISNSYGGSEFSSETSSSYDGHYNHPGIAVTVSSGDNGYGNEFPASSKYVTAVGGTLLQRDATTARGWVETAWTGAGSGCSAYESAPAWQAGKTQCGRRAVADVAADADPASGASIYDSTPYNGQAGWWKVGGTSLAAPLVAGVYALAHDSASYEYPVQKAWQSPGALFDITSGSNGSCTPAVWCVAGSAWDGPTGLGTPNGIGAF
jgi:subtilase family serine protease